VRLTTWNCCRGAFEAKAPLLASLRPDVAAIQECARPAAPSEQCLWFGDNPRQGLAVKARGRYRLRALPVHAGAPKHFFPVEVSGPLSFTLFAVWAHGRQARPYVEAALVAVELYRDLISAGPAVLMGDFNSNAIWNADHKPGWSHADLVARLGDLGLVSAYHHHTREAHGSERTPTYHYHWKRERPFHLDYCFLPKAWAARIQEVAIGSYEDWRPHSDHRPLTVRLAKPAP
jgi:hypothetical protein